MKSFLTGDMMHDRLPIKQSTAENVENLLRKAIITGRLGLGERLVEREVSKRLGVSITPVRQAIQRLSEEGLVDIVPYTGNSVVRIDKTMIRNVSDARILVEVYASGYAYDNLVEDDPSILMDIIEHTVASYERSNDIYEVICHDVLFHETIVKGACNKVLIDMWNIVKSRMMLLQYYEKSHRGFRIGEFVDNHKEIAQALNDHKGQEVFVDCVRNSLERGWELKDSVVSDRQTKIAGAD